MSLFGCDHGPLIAQLRADLAASEANVEEYKRLHEMERRRYDELLQTVLAMKAKGAEVVPVAAGVVTPAESEAREPDELKALIHDMAGGDTRKRALMLKQLKIDRAAKVPEEDIRAAIIAGVQAEGVPA